MPCSLLADCRCNMTSCLKILLLQLPHDDGTPKLRESRLSLQFPLDKYFNYIIRKVTNSSPSGEDLLLLRAGPDTPTGLSLTGILS